VCTSEGGSKEEKVTRRLLAKDVCRSRRINFESVRDTETETESALQTACHPAEEGGNREGGGREGGKEVGGKTVCALQLVADVVTVERRK